MIGNGQYQGNGSGNDFILGYHSIWLVGQTFYHNRRWGSLFMLGLILEVIRINIF
ncbi:MAG: hypothetical protein ABIA75_09130 [Candidatus Neomarinimicrobiota bacterium]